MIHLGLKNLEFKHVMSLRRQPFMILNAEFQSLNTSAKTTLLGKEYTIYISTESMRCFVGSRGVNRMVCHNSIRYRFSYPAIRYLQILQNYTVRFDSIQEYIHRYIDIIILYTYFKQPSTLLLTHKSTKIYNMNINLKMLLWAQC